jgi:hypothetical protein
MTFIGLAYCIRQLLSNVHDYNVSTLHIIKMAPHPRWFTCTMSGSHCHKTTNRHKNEMPCPSVPHLSKGTLICTSAWTPTVQTAELLGSALMILCFHYVHEQWKSILKRHTHNWQVICSFIAAFKLTQNSHLHFEQKEYLGEGHFSEIFAFHTAILIWNSSYFSFSLSSLLRCDPNDDQGICRAISSSLKSDVLLSHHSLNNSILKILLYIISTQTNSTTVDTLPLWNREQWKGRHSSKERYANQKTQTYPSIHWK